MKVRVMKPVEVDVSYIILHVPVDYEDEDMPFDFPGRDGDFWIVVVGITSGQIQGYPKGKPYELHMKVCDGGTYTLFDRAGEELAQLDGEYVPHGVVPGEYGDYIILNIDETGRITNWPTEPDVSAFFPHAAGAEG